MQRSNAPGSTLSQRFPIGHWFILACIGLLMSGCTHLYFYPETEHYWDPARAGIVYEDVWFEAADGIRLHGWMLPAQTEQVHGTVVFAHGNAQNISSHVLNIHWLPEEGFHVFAFDYRGFGRSEGRPDFPGVHRDMVAALHAAADDPRVDPERMVVFGQSLGGSVALTTVAKVGHEMDIRGVAVDSPFASWRGIAREKFAAFVLTWPFQIPLSWTISDQFAPVDHVHELSPIPLLVMVGTLDQIIPPHHGEQLHEHAGEPKELWRIPEATHSTVLAEADVRDRLVLRFREWLGTAD